MTISPAQSEPPFVRWRIQRVELSTKAPIELPVMVVLSNDIQCGEWVESDSSSLGFSPNELFFLFPFNDLFSLRLS